MTALGIALLLLGAVLLVAEAHAPGGVLGAGAAATLIGGGIILIASLGGGAALRCPSASGWGWSRADGRSWRRARPRARGACALRRASESLCGRIGVVRRWSDSVGQVFLDGALWRARHRGGEDGAEALHEGDSVVVEHVNGLTLSVRRAEEWELIA